MIKMSFRQNVLLWAAEQQEALRTAAANLEAKRWEVGEAETEEYIKKLEENGTVIVEFTDEQLKAFSDKIHEEVWPQIKDDFDADLFDEVTKGK